MKATGTDEPLPLSWSHHLRRAPVVCLAAPQQKVVPYHPRLRMLGIRAVECCDRAPRGTSLGARLATQTPPPE